MNHFLQISPKVTIVLCIISVLAIGVYAVISFFIANKFTLSYDNPVQQTATVISTSYQNVTFATADGVALRGWIFPGVSSKAVIMVHGLGQNRVDTNYGAVGIAKALLQKGYTVLLFDLRGHGNSEKSRLGYGFLENKDVEAAVSYLVSKHFDEHRIGIIGNSLGAIAVLHAAPQLQSVGAIIADSPASDMKQLLSERLTTDKHIPHFFAPGVFFVAQYVFGVPLADQMPLTSVEATPERSYLFLHGGHDTSIPVENSQKLVSKANTFSKLVIFKNAQHVQTYKTNPTLYQETVFGFLEQQLGK